MGHVAIKDANMPRYYITVLLNLLIKDYTVEQLYIK